MSTRYTAEHEWVQLEGDLVTVGITDHAQALLGDLVFVQLPQVGAELETGKIAGTVESVKAASDVYAPLNGTVTEINPAVVQEPALVNSAPTTDGWLFRLRLKDPGQFQSLLDEAAYQRLIQ